MLTQTITVNLPDSLYRQVVQRAKRTHSSLEEELLAVPASALSNTDELPSETNDALAQLAYLTGEELWQAAQVSLSYEEKMQMQTWLLKRQAEGLTQIEQEEAEQLLRHSEHIMLLRAQAMALLHERGRNVTQLLYPSIDQ